MGYIELFKAETRHREIYGVTPVPSKAIRAMMLEYLISRVSDSVTLNKLRALYGSINGGRGISKFMYTIHGQIPIPEGSGGAGSYIELSDTNPSYDGAEGMVPVVQGNSLVFAVNNSTSKTIDGYPEGTPMEDILSDILNPGALSGLIYGGYKTVRDYLNSADELNSPNFTWTMSGVVNDLVLKDNLSNTVNIDGGVTSYQSNWSYAPSSATDIVHTIEGKNSKGEYLSTRRTTYFRAPTYVGKNSTGTVPSSADILAGSKYVILTNSSVSLSTNTSASEYGWIAVPKYAKSKIFTQWKVTELDKGAIDEAGGFIRREEVDVNGLTYSVYIYNYVGEKTIPITLS